jgi:holo-[acyl-carrier protein] synthase
MKGIGIDIEQISYFLDKKYDSNKSFYEKIFTASEIKYCLNKPEPYQHFTSRFCVKEAAIKACHDKELKFTDIEIVIIDKVPTINLPNKIPAHVSMSHTDQYATAIVIIL